MNKRSLMAWGAALSVMSCVNCPGIEYKSVKLEEKNTHGDLSFAVTFDNYTTHAEVAKGNANSSLPKLNLGLRGTVGFDTKQGFQPIGDETLFYQAKDNIHTESGTVTLWINAADYAPSEKETDGKKRGNIALFEFMVKNDKSNLLYRLYEFADRIYFDIWLNGEQYPSPAVSASRKLIKKKQWHQIAVTWTSDKVAIYLNGEFNNDATISPKVANAMKNFTMDNAESYFGIPLTAWGEKRSKNVLFDDIKVYNRALSKLEIKKQYAELEKDSTAQKIDLFEAKLCGVDKTFDTLDVEFDFVALPSKYAILLNEKKITLEYSLTGPDGFVKNGKFVPSKLHESLRLNGVDRVGRYTLQTWIVDSTKKIEASTISIDRPDLLFVGNKIGFSDKVPSPWTPVVLKSRTVSVWNRVYAFDKGPFPVSITVNGKQLLTSAPELNITLPSGRTMIQYTALNASATEREVVLTGRGLFSTYSFDYKTVVAYDGMIKTNYVIHGSPQITSMSVEWQVAKDSAQYLMTPLLYEGKNPEFSAQYPKVSWERPTMLWFTSEHYGGFAYAMENDANWSYPEYYPVLKANTNTGKCAVTMIAETVKLPPDTDYQILFIATPTRPRAELKRNTRVNYGRDTDGSRPFLFSVGQGLSDSHSSYKLEPEAFIKEVNAFGLNSFVIYGMANSVTTSNPVGKYFMRDYDIPGAYTYTCEEKVWNSKTKEYDTHTVFSLPACNATSINDYFIKNQYEMIKHPYGNRLWAIYYDLADNTLCSNETHGCGFTDKFGRKVKTLTLLKKRALFERSVQIAHDNDKVVFIHAQRDFIPFMHGMADYWYPGEQNNGLTAKNLNCYTDDISDAIWRSEYNSNVLGVNVIFLPASDTWRVPVAEGMIAQCLLHDIDFSTGYMSYPLCNKVWMTFPKYGIGSKTAFHRYYEQNKVVSNNPELKISYYEVSKDKYLFIIVNRTPKDIAAEVNFSAINLKDGIMREEYRGKEFKLENGKLALVVPGRSFYMLGYPALGFYPYINTCNMPMNFWKENRAVMQAFVDNKTGHSDFGAAAISVDKSNPDSAGGCYTISVPAVPGNTYKLKVWAKGKNIKPESKVHLLFVAQEPNKNIGSVGGTLEPLTAEWKQYMLIWTIPTVEPWNKTTKLQVTLFMKDLNGGTIWFDNIEMTENTGKVKK